MDENEFLAIRRITIANYMSFILLPAVCFLYIIFGYQVGAVIGLEAGLSCILLLNFIPRTVFFIKYPNNIGKGRFLFETISYIGCLIFAIGTAFLVKEDDGVFEYYFLNIYIQPAFMIFTFVVLGYMAGTAKRISRIYLTEFNRRKKEEL